MKLNKFKKLIMISASVLAIAPVATVSAVQTNTQTVQATKRHQYIVLTKKVRFFDNTSQGFWGAYHPGMIMDLTQYVKIGKDKYNDPSYSRTFRIKRNSYKYFGSYKSARRFSRKHYKKYWHEQWLESHPEVEFKIEQKKEKRAQEKANKEWLKELKKQSEDYSKQIDKEREQADKQWNDYINSGNIEDGLE